MITAKEAKELINKTPPMPAELASIETRIKIACDKGKNSIDLSKSLSSDSIEYLKALGYTYSFDICITSGYESGSIFW